MTPFDFAVECEREVVYRFRLLRMATKRAAIAASEQVAECPVWAKIAFKSETVLQR